MDLYTVRKQLNMGVSLTAMRLRVTYYSRVSTDHLEQQKSLKNQVEHFEEMIKNNKNWIYVEGYIDDGISGTTDYKRDSFMKMIEDARNGKFDLIVTKEISRFSRNTLDSIKYTRELLCYGVAVLFVNDNINTALPDSELRLTIMATIAQDEIRRLSERVKFGMSRSIINGTILGNDMLYGYKKDKGTGNLVIIPEEAELVRRLFSLYAIDNYSISKIAKIFNSDDKQILKKKKWYISTLTRMIKNPKYKGYYCGKKSEIIDYMTKKVRIISEKDWIIYEDKLRIPPIVEDVLWERANERLKKRSRSFGYDYKMDKIMYQNRYTLSSKIHCDLDNEVFHRRKQCMVNNDITWICARYLKEGKKACDSPNIRESEIYKIFDDIIKVLEIELSNVSDILLKLYLDKTLIRKDKSFEGNLSDSVFIKDNIEKENRKLERIVEQKINDKITRNQLIELLFDKMVVSKINNDKENVGLKIFFKFSKNYLEKEMQQVEISSMENFKIFMEKEYEFKRGYNTINTRRYIVKYQVKSYICV